MAQLGFIAGDYDPADDFEPVPPGDYEVMITEGDVTFTAKGGQLAKFTYTIMDGPYQGRRIWSQHNVFNESSKAEEIGRKEISRIAHAVGNPKISDTDDLIQKALLVTVDIEQQAGYRDRNFIKTWKPLSGGDAAPRQQNFQGQPQNQSRQQPLPATNPAGAPTGVEGQDAPPHPATAATPPWGRR